MNKNVFRTIVSLVIVVGIIGVFSLVYTKAADEAKAPIVFKKADLDLQPIAFGGKEGDAGWWTTHVNTPISKEMLMGIAIVNPGFGAHAWHVHTFDRKENKGMDIAVEVYYPKSGDEWTFEEFYYIVSGNGVVQWETKDGKIEQKEIGPGDTVFYPRGVAKHQVFNNGKEQMFIVYAGYPMVKFKVEKLKK